MPKSSRSGRNVVMIDSSIDWERRLRFMEKQAGLAVFKSIYWGIFLFITGFMVLLSGYGYIALTTAIGWVLVILSLFVVIYGFVISLHLKLTRKHG